MADEELLPWYFCPVCNFNLGAGDDQPDVFPPCPSCGWVATVHQTFTPDTPLDTPRASRLLAKIMAFLVKCKDRTMTQEENSLVDESIDNFLSPFRNRNQVGPKVAGYPR